MRCYVAGRISGCRDHRRLFAEASEKLRVEGYQVFNPAAANLDRLPLPRIMAYVLGQLCECDAIALQRGWWRSGGARIEFLLAIYLKLKIIYL